MKLSQLTNEYLIELHCKLTSKQDIIQFLIQKLFDEHKISNIQSFYESVMEREALSPTGIDCGIAIPHGKSNTVLKTSFAVAILEQPLSSWESVTPDSTVQYIFLLAIPLSNQKNEQINLLLTLMTHVSHQEYLNKLTTSSTPQEFIQNLDAPLFISTPKNKESIVAVTACTYGVAHTYLAVEALKKAAKDNHIDIYIEKQGASGIIDELTHEQINQALGVIIASDVHIRHMERFKNKNILDEPIKNASQLIYKILN